MSFLKLNNNKIIKSIYSLKINNNNSSTSSSSSYIRNYISKVKLNDGRIIEFEQDNITPEQIIKKIGGSSGSGNNNNSGSSSGSGKNNNNNNNNILKSTLISRINNNQLINLKQSIGLNEYNIEFLNFEDRDARLCFWNTSSLVLANAIKEYYSGDESVNVSIIDYGHLIKDTDQSNLSVDSVLQGSFYVDVHFSNSNQTIKEDDIKKIKKIMDHIIKKNESINQLKVSLNEAKSIFKSNPSISKLLNQQQQQQQQEEESINIIKFGLNENYYLNKFITLQPISKIQSFDLIKNSSVVGNDPSYSNLQRIVGISFPERIQMDSWKDLVKKASLRDHRVVGKNQELFFFHPFSPGSCFFLPHGTKIYNKLLNFLRSEYRKRGYQEVISPNIYSQKLWEQSGHWQNYKDNMFSFECDHTHYSLKPMNCPGHCLMYAHRQRSYKELPMRIADFGVLHRNESHGSLTGLTRVRRFQQDDAHIFCTPDMIREEISQCLDFMKFVYSVFNFTFHLELSTRPDSYLGDIQVWNKAEDALSKVLTEFCGNQWKINPGDGAFYGPKIDIHLKDANGKSHQCATIQLDFQLPIRFNLEYQDNDNQSNNNNNNNNDNTTSTTSINRPVMIHRALFGSVERMMAILMEHTAGKWPFWLSPRQCIIIPVSKLYQDYAKDIQNQLHQSNINIDVDIDTSDKLLPKKVFEARNLQYNYIIVVGQDEMESGILSIRDRENENEKDLRKLSINDLVSEFKFKLDQYK